MLGLGPGCPYQIHLKLLDLEPVSTTSSTIDYIIMVYKRFITSICKKQVPMCPWNSTNTSVFWETSRTTKAKEVVLQERSSRRWPAERVGPNCALSRGSSQTTRVPKKGQYGFGQRFGQDGSDAADEEPLGHVHPHPRPHPPPDYLHRPLRPFHEVCNNPFVNCFSEADKLLEKA